MLHSYQVRFMIDKKKYSIKFDTKGSCNYAFPVILKTKNIRSRDNFEKILLNNKIEFRRGNAGGGNQLRQPYLKKFAKNIKIKQYKIKKNLLIFIDDDGPGIPASEYENVFRPFYKIDKSRGQAKSSVGLGLSIASDIIRSHGGNIALEKSQIGGLKIKVLLPSYSSLKGQHLANFLCHLLGVLSTGFIISTTICEFSLMFTHRFTFMCTSKCLIG